jgi:DNA-binding MarR family transcriptional regulator
MVKRRSSSAQVSEHVIVQLDQKARRGQRDVRRLFDAAESIPGLRGSIGRILSLVPPEGARPTTLADGAWITKQSLGERVREMERLGWVTTDADPVDRRAYIVHRTELGDRVLATAERTIAAMEAEWSAKVGADRYVVFRSVLAELANGGERPELQTADENPE